jgi:hypothetical protein
MLATINWKPTEKDLRSFGKVSLIMLAVIAALLWKLKHLPLAYAICICAAGVLIFILSLISAKLVKPVFITLQVITYPIGLTVSFVIVAIFYYLVLTPVALFFKLIGRDLLKRRFDKNAPTYWVRYNPPDSVGRYFKQF